MALAFDAKTLVKSTDGSLQSSSETRTEKLWGLRQELSSTHSPPAPSTNSQSSSSLDVPNSPPVSGVLPEADAARKSLPIFEGVLNYFPDALLAVSEVSRIGNDQHNPGQPLHWNKAKSMNQYDTLLRHLLDHRAGKRRDTDGARHLAKAAWRALAALQLDIEAERNGG